MAMPWLMGGPLSGISLTGRSLIFPIDPKTNLPLIHMCTCTSAKKKMFQDRFKSKGTHDIGPCMSYDGEIDHYNQYELKKYILYCTPVTDETNQHLNNAQNELLHWHQKLCINMQDL